LGRYKLPLVDAAWLLTLAIFILGGMMLATFHGDEAMQIYMSRDYATVFIDHNPTSLMVNPPYAIDDDPWLRILNGSVNRYAIGLSWQLAGLNAGMLPPRPGWDWGLTYDINVETGHLPPDSLLAAGRISSTLFLIMSTVVMFGIGWQFGGRLPAYFMSGLYALNPVILLNGRRAMMEGSLLAFGLLTIWLAILISKGRTNWRWWVLLTLSAGLTLASKHSGIVFVGGAFGWIGIAEIGRFLTTRSNNALTTRNPIQGLFLTFLKLFMSGVGVILIFIALSPALWNDPVARFGDLIAQRQLLLDIQVASNPDAPTSLLQRIQGIIAQPFMTPAMHYEVSFWANALAISAEIERYMASPLSGLQFGVVLGLPLTLLAGVGIIAAARDWHWWGLLVWLLIAVASLLANPLPWQRYYLPLLPTATVLAGLGFLRVYEFVQKRLQPQSPLVSSGNVPQTKSSDGI
jgi:4-amino-4-deoxy-L-arabinose transferase-like glycosyltransferase